MSGFQLSLHPARQTRFPLQGGALRRATLDKCRGRGRRQRTRPRCAPSFFGKDLHPGPGQLSMPGKAGIIAVVRDWAATRFLGLQRENL